jgi:DNA polymerase-3 subunit delta'
VSFENILGQESAVTEIEKAVSSGRLAHAYLFEGPPGVGKFTTAIELTHHLLCRESKPHKTCRVRSTIENGTNLSVAVIRLNPERRNISINDIRDIVIPALWRKSDNGNYKVIVIDEADYLGVEAQNALLKTLEEPPPNSIIVLIATSREALLPTVISRCQIIRFKPLAAEVIARIRPRSAADMGFEKARKFLLDSVTSVLRDEVDPIECAEQLIGAVKAYAGAVQQRIRKELSLIFDSLLSFLGDMAMRRAESVLSEQPKAESFSFLPEGIPEQICQIVLDTKMHIGRNVNISLALEEFFLKVRALREPRINADKRR